MFLLLISYSCRYHQMFSNSSAMNCKVFYKTAFFSAFVLLSEVLCVKKIIKSCWSYSLYFLQWWAKMYNTEIKNTYIGTRVKLNEFRKHVFKWSEIIVYMHILTFLVPLIGRQKIPVEVLVVKLKLSVADNSYKCWEITFSFYWCKRVTSFNHDLFCCQDT